MLRHRYRRIHFGGDTVNVQHSLFGKPSARHDNDGPDFPPPKPPVRGESFNTGDSVIVTTACEDIEMHDLTGVVKFLGSTGSYYVTLDVDGSVIPFRPHEIGHRY